MSALLTQCPCFTVQTGTGKVDPARKLKCTTVARGMYVYFTAVLYSRVYSDSKFSPQYTHVLHSALYHTSLLKALKLQLSIVRGCGGGDILQKPWNSAFQVKTAHCKNRHSLHRYLIEKFKYLKALKKYIIHCRGCLDEN